MDRRREPRFKTSQPVTLRLLGDNPMTLPGVVQDISGRGMSLRLGCALPLDAAVRVDFGESIILAEVCYSRPEDDEYIVGLMIDQQFHDPLALRPLMDAVSPGVEVPECLHR